MQRAALRWARWLELVSGAAGWVHRAAVESMLGLHRHADKLWFVPSMQIHWPQAEITLRHGNRSLRFVLVRAEAQNAMTACALPDTQLLAVRERLCWKALPPQTCFVMPLWRPAGVPLHRWPRHRSTARWLLCTLPNKPKTISFLSCLALGSLPEDAKKTTAFKLTMPKKTQPDQSANQLLASMPPEVWLRIAPQLELVNLPLGEVLYESGSQIDHVHFPIDAIVSLLYMLENGSSAEIAVAGNEGLVGIALFMGGDTTPSRAVVQSAGKGYRLSAAHVKDEFNRGGPVLHLLLRYTQALITQMAQTAVCNRHHSLDQQLCRWLLLSLDRLKGNDLVMTQELIANMLGVRREGVTEAALKLQKMGLIKYARGRISVLDRPGLEERVCECYMVVKKEYDRLLPERLAV